ncbi:hypothetical protein GS415_10390 [Rhodococcus hoagii]|nr:hypothetical protein [Prescottella equi]
MGQGARRAQEKFRPIEAQITDSFADGQRTLKGRVELMEDVSGYCNLVMDKTYTIASGGVNGWARALPLNVTIGIPKTPHPSTTTSTGPMTSGTESSCRRQELGGWTHRSRFRDLLPRVTVGRLRPICPSGTSAPKPCTRSAGLTSETAYYQTSHTISHT